jgi:hypothetical protein
MQHGSLIKNICKHGPGVWQFRWSEKDPQGKRYYRKRVIGSVGDYSDVDANAFRSFSEYFFVDPAAIFHFVILTRSLLLAVSITS